MFWLGFGIYVLMGVLICTGVYFFALSRRKEALADSFVLFIIGGPEVWILFVFWPIGLAVMIWMTWNAPPPPGPLAIPSQVKTHLQGRDGVVVQELRPSGLVRIDESEYEAVSQLGVIAVGDPVTVIEQDSLRLSVKRKSGEKGPGD